MTASCWLLGGANLAIWGLCCIVFRAAPALLGTCLLAYGLGLRHALDADHIIAIDNVTRKLLLDGRPATGAGGYFALGHSSVVVGMTALAAFHGAAVAGPGRWLVQLGGTAGALISATFLLLIGVANLALLVSLVRTAGRARQPYQHQGLAGRLLQPVLRLITRSWQMYFVGVLFGMGFDTAAEVSLMAMSVAAGTQGVPAWSLMLFPALFTAGMTLVDSADNFLMLRVYRRPLTATGGQVRYTLIVTLISVGAALLVAGLEGAALIQQWLRASGPVWQVVALANRHINWLGFGMVGIFLLCWLCAAHVSTQWKVGRGG